MQEAIILLWHNLQSAMIQYDCKNRQWQYEFLQMKYIAVRVEIYERYLKKTNGKLLNLIMAQPVSFIST